jgi:hypothetical protein
MRKKLTETVSRLSLDRLLAMALMLGCLFYLVAWAFLHLFNARTSATIALVLTLASYISIEIGLAVTGRKEHRTGKKRK